MTEIPEDVHETAYDASDGFSDVYGCDHTIRNRLTKEFERVIMAERERFMNEFEGAAEIGIDAAIEAEREQCAQIAEREGGFLIIDGHGKTIGAEIAAKIRSGQQ